MKRSLLLATVGAVVISASVHVTAAAAPAEPVPYPLLNPPKGVTPEYTRSWFQKSFGKQPKQTWTPEERKAYEERMKWFHEAKYGLFHCYCPRLARSAERRIGEVWQTWDDEKWDEWTDAVDVDKFADQAKELGVGFVVATVGQLHRFHNARNPVLEEAYKLKPGQYSSKRDLPMELGKALEKRGIAMMIYIASISPFGLPRPEGMSKLDEFKTWLKSAQWYSDHYGKLCKGWWVDNAGPDRPDLKNSVQLIVDALKHGNPDALVACGSYQRSDYIHGHCRTPSWKTQQRSKPYFGRWDPEFNIQWQVLLTVGRTWASSDTPKRTEDLVKYAVDVVRGGGVITFDTGIFKEIDGKWVAPFMEITPAQFKQLEAVRDALKNIPVSDGSGR